MKHYVFGSRSNNPAWWDMSCWGGDGQHGFRCGDRAAVLAFLADWRAKNPDRRLVVYDDPHQPQIGLSLVPSEWFLRDIADEIFLADSWKELPGVAPHPQGEALYRESLWVTWHRLRKPGNRSVWPNIVFDPSVKQQIQLDMQALGIPKRYITFHPLWDSTYATHRNCPIEWWQTLCSLLVQQAPVVILGSPNNSKQLNHFAGAYHYHTLGRNMVNSIGVVSSSRFHIGGETGLTLWAGLLDIPQLAVYARPGFSWEAAYDTAPASKSGKIYHVAAKFDPGMVAKRVISALNSL